PDRVPRPGDDAGRRPGGRRPACGTAVPLDVRRQKARVIIARLTSWIAFVTSMPRGHASVQLKVVRQRHTPSLSLRISRRCVAPSSRLSKMKRCALTIAAGPKYWPSVQNTGQDDVHAAHRM